MTTQERLQRLRTFQYVLDSAFRVPGTRVRFGWDPIIGLVPWLGDAVALVLSCVMLIEAFRMRVPRVIQLRMLAVVAADLLVGAIPIVGDVGDMFWKANARNFVLLERHAGGQGRVTIVDRLFAAGLFAMVVVVAALPVVVLYGVYRLVAPG